MLKASLLAAAAFAMVAVAAPLAAYAQQDGSRQIVVEPGSGKGAGTGGGGGLGTGGGDGNGTGGGKKIQKLVVDPTPEAAPEPAPEIATTDPIETPKTEIKKLVVDPAPIETPAKAEPPAVVEADPLDAIIGPPTTETETKTVTKEAPALIEKAPIEKAPALIATTAATVDSPDELIVLLKSKGYDVNVHKKEKDGDYVLVISSNEDKESGYLLVVDHAHGKVVTQQKIDLAQYGYGKPHADDHAKDPYEGDSAYKADGGYEEDSGYDDSYDSHESHSYEGGYEDNSYGGGSGSGY